MLVIVVSAVAVTLLLPETKRLLTERRFSAYGAVWLFGTTAVAMTWLQIHDRLPNPVEYITAVFGSVSKAAERLMKG